MSPKKAVKKDKIIVLNYFNGEILPFFEFNNGIKPQSSVFSLQTAIRYFFIFLICRPQ
jgi:purine nucleoside permease